MRGSLPADVCAAAATAARWRQGRRQRPPGLSRSTLRVPSEFCLAPAALSRLLLLLAWRRAAAPRLSSCPKEKLGKKKLRKLLQKASKNCSKTPQKTLLKTTEKVGAELLAKLIKKHSENLPKNQIFA